MDCSPPGSSIHGILQARILEWVAISFSRGSSQPKDRTRVSHIAGRCFNLWAMRNKEILPFVTRMSVEGIMLNEIRQKKISIVWPQLYVESLKKKKRNLQKQSRVVVTRVWEGAGGKWRDIWVKGYKLPIIRLTSSGALMYSMVITDNNPV